MPTLFTVNFENNKLFDPDDTGFDFICVGGGTLEVNAASKHNGSYGCEVTPLLNYRCGGAKRVHTPTRYRQRFYLNPNGIIFTDTRYIYLHRNWHADASDRVYHLLYRAWASSPGSVAYSRALGCSWGMKISRFR